MSGKSKKSKQQEEDEDALRKANERYIAASLLPGGEHSQAAKAASDEVDEALKRNAQYLPPRRKK